MEIPSAATRAVAAQQALEPTDGARCRIEHPLLWPAWSLVNRSRRQSAVKPVAGAIRRWPSQFRYRGSAHRSAVAQLPTLEPVPKVAGVCDC